MSQRLFGLFRLFSPPGEQPHWPGWRPDADVYRTPTGWLIKAALAGVSPGDIEVSAAGNQVIIRGIRRDVRLENGCCCYQLEIAYSQFERRFVLPVNLEHARLEAEHHHGMLLVRIYLEEDNP